LKDFNLAAEALLELGLAHGARYAFINPGTDTYPIQEAWAARDERGLASPAPIQCAHEFTAASAAHGYFLVSGDPQFVFVHVDVGTMFASGAVSNAWHSKAGLVLCAGRAPYTSSGELPGGKDNYIQWSQEPQDQSGILRNYVKWHYELAVPQAVAPVVSRAFELARSAPAGPVYLTAAREVLMQPVAGVHLPSRKDAQVPAPAQPAAEAVSCAAAALLRARRPLIFAGQNGRDPASVPELARLAHLLGAPVVDGYFAANLPGSHPLNVRNRLDEFLPQADVVLFVDPHVPYVPLLVSPHPDATIIYLESDPLHANQARWEFPADIRLTGSPRLGLVALCEAIADLQTNSDKQAAAERSAFVAREQRQWLAMAEQNVRLRAREYPISPEWLMWCLSQLLPADAIVLEDVVTNREAARVYLPREEPGTLFTPGGACLGWGLNCAIGCKLAAPDRLVLALVGDGGYMFANPYAALWTAEKAAAPVLCVVFDNGGYKAAQEPIPRLFPGGAVERLGHGVVTHIQPRPDHAMVAEAAGAVGLRLERPEEVITTLSRAIHEVKGGRSVVVHAILKPLWQTSTY
jgi:acetolactate synthase-1/2/3 large subunit